MSKREIEQYNRSAVTQEPNEADISDVNAKINALLRRPGQTRTTAAQALLEGVYSLPKEQAELPRNIAAARALLKELAKAGSNN